MCVCKRVGPPLKWFSFIDFLLLIKKNNLRKLRKKEQNKKFKKSHREMIIKISE